MAENIVMTEQQLADFGKQAVNSAIKDLGLDKIDVRHRIVPDDDETKQLSLNPKYRTGKFVKAMLSRNLEAITKAVDPNNETTAADGAYLVPDVTSVEIARIAESYAQVRPECRVVPMGKAETIYINKENAGVTSYWVSENAAITSSKLSLAQVSLVAKKQGAIVPFTSELEEDSIIDWGGYVNYMVGKAFGKEEDSQFCVGTGSPITGIFSTTHTFGNKVQVATPSSITYDNIVDMIYNIDPAKVVGGKIYLHRGVLGVIKKLSDLNGVPLFAPANAGQPASIMDVPVKLFEYAPGVSSNTAGLPLVVYGNLNSAVIGDKKGVSALYSNTAYLDATSMFQNDVAALRFIRRVGFVFAQPGECSTIKIAE